MTDTSALRQWERGQERVQMKKIEKSIDALQVDVANLMEEIRSLTNHAEYTNKRITAVEDLAILLGSGLVSRASCPVEHAFI